MHQNYIKHMHPLLPKKTKMLEEYGPGPWFAALIRDCNTQLSDIIVHTYPELVAAAINFKNRNQTQCEVIMCVGAFDSLVECTQYGDKWNRNKQLKTRVENGRKLFQKHCKHRCMWLSSPPPTVAKATVAAGGALPLLPEKTAVSVGDVVELHGKRKIK